MVRMFVRHDVSDYETWRKVYDSIDADQTAAGVTAKAEYQALDNPNDITVWHDFETAELAHAFAGSSTLHDAMANAGVQGDPQVWFTSPA